VYAQLILENTKLRKVEDELTDTIFSFLVRDFSKFALSQISNYVSSDEQEKYLQAMMKKPAINPEQNKKIWEEHLLPLVGTYTMNR
jgi:acyl-CoA dehydrogenase